MARNVTEPITSIVFDAGVDRWVGGAEYTPKDPDVSECEKYIFTRNPVMEQGVTEIVNDVIEVQEQKGVSISLEELQVLNLAGRTQGWINLQCGNISYEEEAEIIQEIANGLFEKYPEEYGEETERYSWVDVDCRYQMGWRISAGNVGMMV